MYESERERLIYPDVIAATKVGDSQEGEQRAVMHFAEFTTNNMDTVVRGSAYWYIPEEGEPVLVVEIDDEDVPGSADNMDIKIRVRRNDGLVYEGTREDQELQRCKICREEIHQVKEWKHVHSGEMYCHTGDGSMALPEREAS